MADQRAQVQRLAKRLQAIQGQVDNCYAVAIGRQNFGGMSPDFARTGDIHRKPGYDPLELFIDPRIRFPKLTIAHKLLRKRLGFRTLMGVIPLDASMVRGSHGRVDLPNELQPIMMTAMDIGDPPQPIPCANVKDILLRHLINE